jgi:F0F1-type ATP synthase assembly protein I|tara:strand:- start:27 stop:206 length:180 start_codon:yes stop_codon:yes gene_type:complete
MDGFGLIVGLIVAAIIGVLIAKDANSRGMNGSGWGIFVFLICIVALPIYLVVRKPVKEE